MGHGHEHDADIGRICMDAIRKDAFAKGFGKGFSEGAEAEHDAIMKAFFAASSVTKVVHNGPMTIVYFEDGDQAKVTYDPSYGYAYDREKGVMAAILKHVTGNSYLKALKRFEANGEAIVIGNEAVRDSLYDGKMNVTRAMAKRLDESGSAFGRDVDTPPADFGVSDTDDNSNDLVDAVAEIPIFDSEFFYGNGDMGIDTDPKAEDEYPCGSLKDNAFGIPDAEFMAEQTEQDTEAKLDDEYPGDLPQMDPADLPDADFLAGNDNDSDDDILGDFPYESFNVLPAGDF